MQPLQATSQDFAITSAAEASTVQIAGPGGPTESLRVYPYPAALTVAAPHQPAPSAVTYRADGSLIVYPARMAVDELYPLKLPDGDFIFAIKDASQAVEYFSWSRPSA